MNEKDYEELKSISRDLHDVLFKAAHIADLDGGKLVAGVVSEFSEKLGELSHLIYNTKVREE